MIATAGAFQSYLNRERGENGMGTVAARKIDKEQHSGDASPGVDEIQMAYQAHTLAQIVYGQLAARYPWLGCSVAGTAMPHSLSRGIHGGGMPSYPPGWGV